MPIISPVPGGPASGPPEPHLRDRATYALAVHGAGAVVVLSAPRGKKPLRIPGEFVERCQSRVYYSYDAREVLRWLRDV